MNIIVVGGGAGGLELVTRLGRTLSKKIKQPAHITLVDKNRTHLWKPLLHEVAAGSMDPGIDGLSYRSHAYHHGFHFQLGELTDINRQQKTISLAPIYDDQGHIILKERVLPYDYLVIAIGSVSNDFNTPGIREHCIYLDSPQQAEKFHVALMDRFLRYTQEDSNDEAVHIAIVGAGATGVELSAELYNAVEHLKVYGFKGLSKDRLQVSIVEAGSRILPALPEGIAQMAQRELHKLGVQIYTETRVTEATETGLKTQDGTEIPAHLMVWAAGIKAPAFLHEIGGLETNRINQLHVKRTLQTTLDDFIFAIGDCAFCLQDSGKPVPPRAQSAHQMADHTYLNLIAHIQDKPLKDYHYQDHGSLINMSRYSTVGALMGRWFHRGSMAVEGRVARTLYVSLYRLHLIALHGYIRTGLMMFVERINKYLRPKLKLH